MDIGLDKDARARTHTHTTGQPEKQRGTEESFKTKKNIEYHKGKKRQSNFF